MKWCSEAGERNRADLLDRSLDEWNERYMEESGTFLKTYFMQISLDQWSPLEERTT